MAAEATRAKLNSNPPVLILDILSADLKTPSVTDS